MSAADDAFVRHKSRHAVTWALLNLRRLHEHASVTSAGTPLAGRTAIIVGAGPSLLRNGERLIDAQKKGVAILAVNSSDGALRALAVVPDVLVARESLDLGEDIAACRAPLIALDICAHPSMWDAAEGRLAWFIPGYPRHMRVCQGIGVRPVFGGTSALCSATKIALMWGAARIVLVGVDLALAPDGRAYHPDTPRLRDLRADVAVDGRGEHLAFSGWDENSALCLASGQPAQPSKQRFERVPAADWSAMLPTTDPWQDQRDWLEIEASRHGARVELLNATEGGGGIIGWRVTTLERVVSDEPQRDPIVVPAVYPVGRAENGMLIDELRRCADLQESISRCMLAPTGPDISRFQDHAGFVMGSPLTEALAAHRTIDAPKGDPAKRCAHIYGAHLEMAAEAQRILATVEAT